MSALAEFVRRRMYAARHRPTPQHLEMFRRYQCQSCHSWIFYDEGAGQWWHNSEKNMTKYWDGAKWVLDLIPYGMTAEEWQRRLDSYR